jgi:3,4-dihydroxy 2-butanone 4-phosphate synthase/GTP cyclohydrolase II
MTQAKITTIKQFGSYSVTGPTKLHLQLAGSKKISLFTHYGFKFGPNRYSAIIKGNIKGKRNILVRISSNCQWSFYFDNQYCDCRWQLEKAKELINAEDKGLIIFAHDQHGKGVGIEDHWKIYAEGQKRKLELVVDSYIQLGYHEDYREYDEVAEILKHFQLNEMRLLTNAPKRIKALERHGLKVQRVKLEEPLNPHLKEEYVTKKRKLGHLLSF